MDRTAVSREFIRGFTNTTYFVGRYAVDGPPPWTRSSRKEGLISGL
jgi:hypothetical protein